MISRISMDFTNFNGFQAKKSLKSTFGVQYIPLDKIFKREKNSICQKKMSIFPRKVFYGISNLTFIFWEEWDGNSFEMGL
jgi:hypothetical protein